MIRESVGEGTIKQLTGNSKNIKMLNEELGDIELTEAEERTLIWLSSWETSTVKHVLSVMKKYKNK